MAVDFKTSLPFEYYSRFLEQDVRPDGRDLGGIRPTTLNVGSIDTADGSALVKLGNTCILCGIKAEMVASNPETPEQGIVDSSVSLLPMSTPQFRDRPPVDLAPSCTHFIEQLLTCSGCLDLKDLCIEKGKHAWNLHCDLMCLDYDGNVLDACCLALIAALKNTVLPKVTIDEESGTVKLDAKEKHPLSVNAVPVSTTLAIFADKVLFVDPTQEEESLATGFITVVTKDDDHICMTYKPGGSSVQPSQMQDCIKRSQHRRPEVLQLIRQALLTVEAER
ncbi:hypothetical protein CAPTEDRAFT_173435 [Capitella teleta]|uniref:Ribosomal RNA-processing protein 43 n=1 Tax=Capitella teleta TaxID=283909 RepID=R7TKM0_CAPTE|nr:hypothetical protein CAPTEDRAFT_173435 [Capitella teleta]|eukprot:ELT94047.1 hypothetical protein CAPTEDRAFT_173435 [Capitella teleta]